MNQNLRSIKDLTEEVEVPIDGKIEITNGKKVLVSMKKEEGWHCLQLQIKNNKNNN